MILEELENEESELNINGESKSRFEKWSGRIQEFKKTTTGQRLGKVFKFTFLAAIVIYLIYQLKTIGLRNVIENLPTHPVFYLIYIFLYLSVPLGEVIIYRLFWHFSFIDGLKTFISKKVLNQDVVQYSGEVFLFNWAKSRLGLRSREVFQVVKDNSIISSITATITAIFLLSYFIYFSDIDIPNILHIDSQHLALISGGIAVILIIIFIFRKRVFSVAGDKIVLMWLIHQARLLIAYGVEIIQWSIIIPGVPLYIWFSLLSVKIIMSRIPFIPNQDLVYTGISIEIAKSIKLPQAEIAGIFIVNMVLNKLVNIVLFTIFNIRNKKKNNAAALTN